MKNSSVLIILFFSCIGIKSIALATTQETFLHANSRYEQGDYAQAQKLYESIDNKGAAVWYNLGNCSYQLGLFPEALVFWKRALKFGGSSWYEDIEHNCKQVEELLGIHQLDSWYNYLARGINNHSLLWWQIVVLVLLSGIGILLLFFESKKYTIVVGIFLVGTSFATTGLGIKYFELSKNYAVVKEETPVIAGTDDRFSKLALLNKGQSVLVCEQQGKWVKIATNEVKGWVLADTIITI